MFSSKRKPIFRQDLSEIDLVGTIQYLTEVISREWRVLRLRGFGFDQIIKLYCEKIALLQRPLTEKETLKLCLLERWWLDLMDRNSKIHVIRKIDIQKKTIQQIIEEFSRIQLSIEDKAFFRLALLKKWWLLLSNTGLRSSDIIKEMLSSINSFSLCQNTKSFWKINLIELWRLDLKDLLSPDEIRKTFLRTIYHMEISLEDKMLLQRNHLHRWWTHLKIAEVSVSQDTLLKITQVSELSAVEREQKIKTGELTDFIRSLGEEEAVLLECIVVMLLHSIMQMPIPDNKQELMQVTLLSAYGIYFEQFEFIEKVISILKFVSLSKEKKDRLKVKLFTPWWQDYCLKQEVSILEKIDQMSLQAGDLQLLKLAMLNYWWQEIKDPILVSKKIFSLFLNAPKYEGLAIDLLSQFWMDLRALNVSAYQIIDRVISSLGAVRLTPKKKMFFVYLFRQCWSSFEFSQLGIYYFFAKNMSEIERYPIIDELETLKINLLKEWAVVLEEFGFSKTFIFCLLIHESDCISLSEEQKELFQTELVKQYWQDFNHLRPLHYALKKQLRFIHTMNLPEKEEIFLKSQFEALYQMELSSCARQLDFFEEELESFRLR